MLSLLKEVALYATPIISILSFIWSVYLFFYFKGLKAKIHKEPKPIKQKPKMVKQLKAHTAYRVFVYDENKRAIKDVTFETKCKAKKEVKKIFKDLDKADTYEIVKIKIKK